MKKSNILYNMQCNHSNHNHNDLERHIETYHLNLEYPCDYDIEFTKLEKYESESHNFKSFFIDLFW